MQRRKLLSTIACFSTALTMTAASLDSRIVELGPHHRVIEVSRWATNLFGAAELVTSRYTELQNGLHYLHNGRWLESEEIVEPVFDGAIASRGSYKVHFNNNINTEGAIAIELPNGASLRASVLALGIFDAATGKRIIIAQVKDSVGEILPPNRVIYRDAFAGLQADVLLTYGKGKFEQDIIIRENPELPNGIVPESARLQVITEIIEAPTFQRTAHVLKMETEPLRRAAMADPDLIDETLDFGAMQMILGNAFMVGDNGAEDTTVVAKQVEQIDGRTFLVESLDWPSIQPALEKLPKPVALNFQRDLPATRLAGLHSSPLEVASIELPNSGFWIDYVLVNSQSSYTFLSGVTYLISGYVNISYWATFQNGAILKYDRNAQLTLSGYVTVPSGNPAILTARDDNSVGEDIHTGALSGYYAYTALNPYYVSSGTTFKNFEIRHATRAITDYSPYASHTYQLCYLVNCSQGVGAYYTSVAMDTLLLCSVITPYYNYGSASFNIGTLLTSCSEVNTHHLNGSEVIPAAIGNEVEPAVAINPVDPNKIVIVARISDAGFANSYMPRMASSDGGATWTYSQSLIGPGGIMPQPRGDPSLTYDSFGNLFLAYLANNDNNDIVVLRSIDNGNQWQQVMRSDGGRFPSGGGNYVLGYPDQPTVVTGPSGLSGPGDPSASIWVLFMRSYPVDFITGDRDQEMVVTHSGVRGNGQTDAFPCGPPEDCPHLEPLNGSVNCNFGDIAIGPNGAVAVVYQTLYNLSDPSDPNLHQQGPSQLRMNVDPDGLGPSSFGNALLLRTITVGGFDAIPAQAHRTIPSEVSLAWDRSSGPHRGRLYVMFTDEQPDESNDTDVWVQYTDNPLAALPSWSAPRRVNDVTTGSQFLPRIALDQTTGYIAFSWYDSRRDASTGNSKAEYFATISKDGGDTFLPSFRLSHGQSDPSLAYFPNDGVLYFDYGDYSALDFTAGRFFPVWCDNSNSTGDNPIAPDGKQRLDIYTRKVQF